MRVARERTSDKRRAAGYARVSSLRQAEEGLSIEEQPRRLRERIAAEGWVCTEIYTDPGVSGRSMQKREGLLTMLQDAEAGEFDVLVIPSLDRLGRSVRDLATIFDGLNAAGVQVISLRGDVDTQGGATATLTTNVMSALAQFYSDLLAESVKGVAAARVREKRQPWFSRHPLKGFKLVGEARHKTYVPDPDTRWIIERAFREVDEGKPVTAVVRDFHRERLDSCSVTTMTKRLVNPAYIGMTRVPGSDELVQTHEGIIDPARFARVGSLIASRRRLPNQARGRPPAPEFWMRGLLRCGQCGLALKPVRGRPRKDGTRPDRYVCPTAEQLGREFCPTRLPVEAVHEPVLDMLLRRGIDFDESRAQVAERYYETRRQVAAMHLRAARQVGRFEDQLRRQLGRWRDGKLTDAEWEEEKAEITADLVAAKDEAARFQARIDEIDASLPLLEPEGLVTQFFEDLRGAVAVGIEDAQTADAVRAVLLRFFESFTVIPLLGDLDGYMEPHWPSIGTDWKVTKGMCASDFDLVPKLRPGIRELIPTPVAVPVTKCDSSR